MSQMFAFISGLIFASVLGITSAENEPRFLLGVVAIAAAIASAVSAIGKFA